MYLKKLKKNPKKGASVTEYIFLVTVVLLALYVFGGYFMRGFMGRWKESADSFGFGMRFDPRTTIQCAYDDLHTNTWYNLTCYEDNCDCISTSFNVTACVACINGCNITECN